MQARIVLIVLVAQLGAMEHGVLADHHEKAVIRYLRNMINVLERPSDNQSVPVQVTLSITLNQIIDLDEKNQILTINAWLNYMWNDYKMTWNASEYGGIGSVRFPAKSVWKPDVLMYNSVDSAFDSSYPSNVVVYSDGTMNWIPPGIYKVSCKVDITYFPFDEQECFMKFGSWTYDGFKLELNPSDTEVGFDMSEYMVNGEWTIKKTWANKSMKYYECCEAPYIDVRFFLRVRRRVLYYAINLIIPNTAITFMTMLGFMLPVEAYEKITLQITVLLSICVFLNIVATIMPPTSEAIPLVGAFFLMCLVLNSASCVFTVLVINLCIRNPDTHEMGKWTKILFLHWFPWILRMKRPDYEFSWKAMPPIPTFCSADLEEPSESLMRNVREDDEEDVMRPRRNSLDLETKINYCLSKLIANPSEISTGQQAEIMALQRICSQLKFITTTMYENDTWEDVVQDWQFVAMVVDRVCLCSMFVAINMSVAYLLIRAPYLYE